MSLKELSKAVSEMKSAADFERVDRIAREHLEQNPEDTIQVGSTMEMAEMLRGAFEIMEARTEAGNAEDIDAEGN